jgi:hypothetical protein
MSRRNAAASTTATAVARRTVLSIRAREAGAAPDGGGVAATRLGALCEVSRDVTAAGPRLNADVNPTIRGHRR